MNKKEIPDKFTNDFLEYLNNDSLGVLLIDDLWGVGKTFSTKEIITTDKYKEEVKKIKYYAILNVDSFNNEMNLKDYILNRLKKIHTERHTSFNIEKNTKLKLEVPEKVIDICNGIRETTEVIISSALKVFQINADIDYIKNKINKILSIFNKNTILDNEIVLIIDEIERKRDTIELKDIFLKIIDLQENDKIKIILIMNSMELNDKDKNILNVWREKAIYKTLNLKSHEVLDEIQGIDEIRYLIKTYNPYNPFKYEYLSNIRILQKAEKFIKKLKTIIKESNTAENYENNRKLIENEISFILVVVLDYLHGKNYFFEYDIDLYEAIKGYFNYEDNLLIYYVDKKFNSHIENDTLNFHIESRSHKEDEIVLLIINEVFNNFYDGFIKELKNDPNFNFNYNRIKNNIVYRRKEQIFFNKYDTKDLLLFTGKDIKKIWSIPLKLDLYKEHFTIINWLEFSFYILKKKFEYTINYLDKNKSNGYSLYYDYLILHILNNYKRDFKYAQKILKSLRNDIFVRKIEKDLSNSYDFFLKELNEKVIIKFNVHDNIRIIKHNFKYNFSNINLIKQLANNIDSNYKRVDIQTSILRLYQIDKDIIMNIEYMLENKEKFNFNNSEYYSVKKAIDNIKYNINNNIIQYMEYDEIKKDIEFGIKIIKYNQKKEKIKKEIKRMDNNFDFFFNYNSNN